MRHIGRTKGVSLSHDVVVFNQSQLCLKKGIIRVNPWQTSLASRNAILFVPTSRGVVRVAPVSVVPFDDAQIRQERLVG